MRGTSVWQESQYGEMKCTVYIDIVSPFLEARGGACEILHPPSAAVLPMFARRLGRRGRS